MKWNENIELAVNLFYESDMFNDEWQTTLRLTHHLVYYRTFGMTKCQHSFSLLKIFILILYRGTVLVIVVCTEYTHSPTG